MKYSLSRKFLREARVKRGYNPIKISSAVDRERSALSETAIQSVATYARPLDGRDPIVEEDPERQNDTRKRYSYQKIVNHLES